MLRQLPTRQRIRTGITVLAFLSFPITMNFLSPYVIVDSAAQGIVNGSLIIFGLMFLSALFLGRAWCGWVCPGAGVQEIFAPVNIRPSAADAVGAVSCRRIDSATVSVVTAAISRIVPSAAVP